VLTATGQFDVRVCETPVGLSAKTIADFDAIVDDWAGAALGAETEQAICDFVASGKGLVVTNAAVGGSKADSREFAKLMGAAASTKTHLASVEFVEIELVWPEHPIVKGMTPHFKIADGLYRGLTVGPDTDVIAKSHDDVVLSTSTYGKGRVFRTAMGHDLAA